MALAGSDLGLAWVTPFAGLLGGPSSVLDNAPNFMVKAVAEERGLRMPSFGGHVPWSGAMLLPLLFVMAWIWMR